MKRFFYLVILFLLFSCNNEDIELEFKDNQNNSELITVYISGAVNTEGVYMIECDKLLIDLINKAGGFSSDADTSTINLARPLNSNEMIVIPRRANSVEENSSIQTLININTASLEELQKIPNIGKSIAENIIVERTTNGFFTTIEDIKRVSGIKNGLFEKIKRYITV